VIGTNTGEVEMHTFLMDIFNGRHRFRDIGEDESIILKLFWEVSWN
jgi:hypothetical protein